MREPLPSPDPAFAALSQHFLDGYFQHSPEEATIDGEHRYDGRWSDFSVEGEADYRRFLEDTLAQLGRIPRGSLGTDNQVDAEILENQLRYELFALTELRSTELRPVSYTQNIGAGLDPFVNRNFGTPESRMASLISRLDGIPAIVAVAKKRLGHPARVQTETALQQNAGLIALTEHDLPSRFSDAPGLTAAAGRAAAALHDLQGFLETELLPRSDGSFRLGREKFRTKLGFLLSEDVDVDALATSARQLLDRTQEEMVDTAKQVWAQERMGKLHALGTAEQKRAFVRRVLDVLAKDRSNSASILRDSKVWLEKATAFVREKNLVRVPDEPVAVIEMPEYRRGVAVAYCDSSGPLEPKPETFFTISPPPADWPPKRVESFFREYNQSMLADLTVHEAMPGHYLQLMHNNQFPSKLRAVLASGPFVEGWAVYSEWLMAEKGFGGPRVKLQRQKMVLRMAANALLDHGVHAGTMEEKEALALMMADAFQEEGEAVGKWRRARLTSAQLTTYFFGFTEMYKLRQASQAKPGFSERAYHDRLLSCGSPGMKFVR
ncbi:MAG TPA: DUF885 domain-containing protein, partial [Myxococcaceae bacterium]|nr:DUF885 domain-containing protein [Myxococcaceae bacterium]